MKKALRSCGILLGIPVGLFLYVACVPTVSAQPAVVPYVGLDVQGVGYWSCDMSASDYKAGANNNTWELISPIVNTWAGTTMTVSNVVFDTDPLIYNNILVQNNTLVNQIYSVTVSIPTVFAAPNLIRGSIDTSLIGTTATVSTVPTFSIYSAQIDFVTVQTLQNDPFSLSTPAGAVSSSASFGYQVSFVPVTSNIGIQLRFELTPGDTVAIVSDFEIIPVPEPGTLALLVLGGSILVLRRQRR